MSRAERFPALLGRFPLTRLSLWINHSSTSWHERRSHADDEGLLGDSQEERKAGARGRGGAPNGAGRVRAHNNLCVYCVADTHWLPMLRTMSLWGMNEAAAPVRVERAYSGPWVCSKMPSKLFHQQSVWVCVCLCLKARRAHCNASWDGC